MSITDQLIQYAVNRPAELYKIFVTTLIPIVNLSGFLYLVFKDKTKIYISAQRLTFGALALQAPLEEYIYISAYNKGNEPVAITELGFISSKGEKINLVDLPLSMIDLERSSNILGSSKYIAIPGELSPKQKGAAVFFYSKMIEYAKVISTKEDIQKSLGEKRVDQAFKAIQPLMKDSVVKIMPYVSTADNKVFKGKKSLIKLGSIDDLM